MYAYMYNMYMYYDCYHYYDYYYYYSSSYYYYYYGRKVYLVVDGKYRSDNRKTLTVDAGARPIRTARLRTINNTI